MRASAGRIHIAFKSNVRIDFFVLTQWQLAAWLQVFNNINQGYQTGANCYTVLPSVFRVSNVLSYDGIIVTPETGYFAWENFSPDAGSITMAITQVTGQQLGLGSMFYAGTVTLIVGVVILSVTLYEKSRVENLPQREKRCKNCRSILPDGAAFCGECGHPIM